MAVLWVRLIVAMLVVAGCSETTVPGSGAPPTPGPATGTTARPTRSIQAPALPGAACRSPSPHAPWKQGRLLQEVHGTGRNAELWALAPLPLTVGRVKIVWRMTGSGPLRLRAIHQDGTQLGPAEGPTAHEGSNWRRPGDEWGSGFVFPEPGCWVVQATRDVGAGEVVLNLSPRSGGG